MVSDTEIHKGSMAHEELLQDIVRHLSAEAGIEALFLAGSHGQSKADRFSDIDLVAIADEKHHERVAKLWRATLESLSTVVFWNERRGHRLLLNAITADWLRCDLYVVSSAHFLGRARTTVKPLFDRSGIYEALPETLPPATPNAIHVSYLIHEFIRILGLMTVGVGRREYVTLVKGVGLLRDLLTDLMLEQCPLPDRGGALHLSRLLTIDQMAMLEALPCPGPQRDALIDAHIATAEAFFPLARELAAQLSIDWPHDFETAMRRHLRTELGIEFG